MTQPATYNLPTIKQGARFYLPMKYKDSTGALIDLTGYTATMHVRRTANGPLIAEFKSADSTIKLMTDPDYNIIFDWSSVLTAALPPGQFVYDLKLSSGVGADIFPLEGQFPVESAVTHA